MVSKKQKVKTVILVLILAAAIVGGVFGISYYKGGVTFPWQVASTDVEQKEVAEESKEDDVKLKVVETKDNKQEVTEEKTEDKELPEVKEDEPEVEEKEEAPEETAEVVKTMGYYGPLHVEEGRLVDEDGDLVQLTGVSSHGLSWYPEYVSADTIASLKDEWGINVIRLAMYTSDYNGYCVGGEKNQAALKETIDEAVTAATDNDMYVIIDWHILNDGDPNEYKAEAIQFFGEMVRQYKDNENVIYEICNEPNGDVKWSDVKSYATELIPVIRNVDKDALILVGTPEYSSDLQSVVNDPLKFDNVMYTYHFYAGTHKSGARSSLTEALDAGLPVFISEYGNVSADGDGAVDTEEAAKWEKIIDKYGLSTCIWNLSNKDEGSALISSECDKTEDFDYEDLTEQGKFFVDSLGVKFEEADEEDEEDTEDTEDTEEDITEDSEESEDTEATQSQSSKKEKKSTDKKKISKKTNVKKTKSNTEN